MEEAKIPRIIRNTNNNTEINLNKLVIVHDAMNCFNYLFPDLGDDSDELNDLYNLAKMKNSENIVKIFEQEQINLDFDFDLFRENEATTVL
jgi:hypothetical protein